MEAELCASMAEVYEYNVQAALLERTDAPCLMVFRVKYDDPSTFYQLFDNELDILAGELISKLPEQERGAHDSPVAIWCTCWQTW